jgi:hypothetical protein
MNLTPLLFGAGAVGPFASRVFLPAFVTALLLRIGVDYPHSPLAHLGVLAAVRHGPSWFTSDACLIVLGTLAALETFGQKTPEVRRLLHEFDLYLKPALALLTTIGVMNATDATFVTHTANQAGVIDGLIPVAVALATWRVARARQPVASAIFDHLEGTHVDHLLSWTEDAWAAFGPVILVLFPIVMLVLTGAVVAVLMVVRRQLARAEAAARVPCPQCSSLVFPCAVACQTCRRPVDRPAAVGFLGLSKPYPAPDPAAQPFNLAERLRCPVCATRLPAGHPRKSCAACGDVSRSTPAFATNYAAHVAWKLPRVLVVTFLLGLIPVVGLIVGVIYYRAVLVLPFAEHLPMGRRFLLRWGVRLLFLLLALCQVIPLLGGFVVPVMAAISFEAYRRAYLATMTDPARSDAAVATALAV